MKKRASVALGLALSAQTTWVALNGAVLHRAPGVDLAGEVILVSFVAFAFLRERRGWSWLSVVVRWLVAAEFLLAVGDRFGLLGPPGASGVSWGDFDHFVDYTRSVASFLPASLAPTLAVLATAAEITLGLALLLGVRLRSAALGAAVLLLVYGASMSVSLPAAEQFHYNVFVLGTGMATLATLDRRPLTLEGLFHRRPGGPGRFGIGIRQPPGQTDAGPVTGSKPRSAKTRLAANMALSALGKPQ